jgi:BASS family bile acid:Na+ symporter
MNLMTLIRFVLETSIVLNVLALGLTATLSDTVFLFRRPYQLLRAFLSINVMMPLIALVLILKANLSPPVNIALGALSVSPVPPLFPKKALRTGGKENYTLGLLVAVALLAIVVMPVTLEIFEHILSVPLRMPAREIAILVFKTILAPLLFGILLRASVPEFAERTFGAIGTVASVLLIVGVIPVFIVSARPMLSLVGGGTLLSLIVFVLAGFIIGYLLGGPKPEKRRVLSLATASRHPGVALAIASANFPTQKLALPAIAMYLILNALAVTLLSGWRARERNASTSGKQRAA